MMLSEFLKLNGWSQAELAARVGSTGATISRVVSGQVVPRRRLMLAIVEVTGGQVGVADLVRGTGGDGSVDFQKTKADGTAEG